MSTDVRPTSHGRVPSTAVLDSLDDALTAVADQNLSMESRAALYAVLHLIQVRIRRGLGLLGRRGMGPNPRTELISYMEANQTTRLGPLRLRASSEGVHYVCNDEANWEDATVQDTLRDIVLPLAPEYVRHIPAHYEIRSKELGEAVAARDPVALQLWQELTDRGWRTVEAQRLSLTVEEAR